MSFFQIFHEKPLLLCPNLVRRVHAVKTTLYYEPKWSIGCLFFIICDEKIIALMPLIFLRKVHYEKKNGNFAQKAKFVEYYSVDWTKIS